MTEIMTKSDLQSAFQTDGYVIHAEPLLPANLVQGAIAGMDAIRNGVYDTGLPPRPSPWKPGDDPNQLCKIESPQFASYAIRELINAPALGEWCAAATGAEAVQIWWIQLLYKPPVVPGTVAKTNVGMHQDWTYWQRTWADGSELFTAWVALSDVTAESGPMKFVRGSHQWGDLAESDFFEQDLEAQVRKIRSSTDHQWEEAAAILAPGGVSLHDKLTWHGSGPNTANGPRRSFAIHMRTQNSAPRDGIRRGLTEFITDFELCPVIYGDRALMKMN
ncbi:MAG: phytanoyl-CoA dioxygenase family protein [Caldilineaceae bacterium]|nr:phytanoyl-CoA dioxygenase family protein [Caldilineaceae bacterium]